MVVFAFVDICPMISWRTSPGYTRLLPNHSRDRLSLPCDSNEDRKWMDYFIVYMCGSEDGWMDAFTREKSHLRMISCYDMLWYWFIAPYISSTASPRSAGTQPLFIDSHIECPFWQEQNAQPHYRKYLVAIKSFLIGEVVRVTSAKLASCLATPLSPLCRSLAVLLLPFEVGKVCCVCHSECKSRGLAQPPVLPNICPQSRPGMAPFSCLL